MTIYIPTEDLAEGQLVAVYGPGVDKAVDWSAGLARGRRRALAGRCSGLPGGDRNLPAGVGPSGIEQRAIEIRTDPLCFGTYEYGVELYDPETGAAISGTKATVTQFVNSSPRPAREFRRETATVPVGVVVFGFVPSEDLT